MARVLRVSDLVPPRPAAPFKDLCAQGVAFAATRPAHWGAHKGDWLAVGKGRGAAWGAAPRGGREAGAWGA